MKKIIDSGELHSSEGEITSQDLDSNGNLYSGELSKVPAMCFADIPLNDLSLHMSKYSRVGLSFLKSFLIKKGAKPVIYVPMSSCTYITKENRGAAIPRQFREILKNLMTLSRELAPEEFAEPHRMSDTKVLSLDPEIQNLLNRLASAWPILLSEFYYFIKIFDDTKDDDAIDNY